MRALNEAELNTYLAACDGATDEQLLDIAAPDGVSLRDILTQANSTVEVTFTDVAPETAALMMGLPPEGYTTSGPVIPEHPIHAEGRALVKGILERKRESEGK